MTFYQAYALGQRNAAACEGAREPKCRCHCGGAQHGKAHSDLETRAWAASVCEQIELPGCEPWPKRPTRRSDVA